MVADPPQDDLSELVRALNRRAAGADGRIADDAAPPPADAAARRQVEGWLAEAARKQASDLLLVAGYAPAVRVDGALSFLGEKRLSAPEVTRLCVSILDDRQRRELYRERSLDLGWKLGGVARFRGNLHFQGGALAAAIRLLPAAIPDLDRLGLPESAALLADLEEGLVLVTGPTGSGKTTTLAALVNAIHRRRRVHILTVEEPVEYLHGEGLGVVEQIEVGRDAPSFAAALRSILRQDPDVLMVGEMRDGETMAMALTAAETGHLVLATVHTNDAAQTIDRIIDSFSGDRQNQVRSQISLALTCVISQRLLPAAEGGRILAAEILWLDDAVRNLIRTGKVHQIRAQMAVARSAGSVTLEACLADLVRAGRVTERTAAARAPHPEEFRRLLSGGSGGRP
jgi:twitching motility protein PilT